MPDQRNTLGTTSGNNIKLDNVVLDVYSKDILYQAAPLLRFKSVFQEQTELMTTPGTTIKFLRYASLSGKSDIAENSTVEAATLSTSLVSISVSEHVMAVKFSELLLRSSSDTVLTRAATLLGQHYAKDVDRLCRDTLLAATSVDWAKSRANRAALTAVDYLDVAMIRDDVETLATKKAPKMNGDAYVCFVHPHQSRRLKDDSKWENASLYGAPNQIFTGEIGRIEDVRFIETTMVTRIPATTQDIWADGEDTGDNTAVAANAATDVYQAIMVGDYAAGFATSLPVEMRDDGVQDYGRTHSLAYYGIWGAGIIEDGHILIMETA